MKTIGILYICTGPYVLFWEDFFKSFEEKFLIDYEKHYFVFTDSDSIFASDNDRVHRYYLQAQPWPLVTLFRFSTFLSIEKELLQFDYLMFSNANIVCVEEVCADEILPRASKAETLFVTAHPGYYGKRKTTFPYERRRNSLAYIPWHLGETYVIGAFFGGSCNAFLSLCKTLKKNIEEDLKNNIIARWHDESHLNNYIVGKTFIRIISPEYCYPDGMKVLYKKRIAGVSKLAKFDINSFKGVYNTKDLSLFKKVQNFIKFRTMGSLNWFFYLKDKILNRKLNRNIFSD